MANVTIQLRRGKKVTWEEKNPVLAYGEPGYIKETGELKIGDGETSWNDLPVLSNNAIVMCKENNYPENDNLLSYDELYHLIHREHMDGIWLVYRQDSNPEKALLKLMAEKSTKTVDMDVSIIAFEGVYISGRIKLCLECYPDNSWHEKYELINPYFSLAATTDGTLALENEDDIYCLASWLHSFQNGNAIGAMPIIRYREDNGDIMFFKLECIGSSAIVFRGAYMLEEGIGYSFCICDGTTWEIKFLPTLTIVPANNDIGMAAITVDENNNVIAKI